MIKVHEHKSLQVYTSPGKTVTKKLQGTQGGTPYNLWNKERNDVNYRNTNEMKMSPSQLQSQSGKQKIFGASTGLKPIHGLNIHTPVLCQLSYEDP